mmetsp:Transcript_26157/g.25004  ORF Transcript_26157/g.25004 Transcript_26157/m.25004 type:complete len:97 (+) Transcript_26157:47-337(+)
MTHPHNKIFFYIHIDLKQLSKFVFLGILVTDLFGHSLFHANAEHDHHNQICKNLVIFITSKYEDVGRNERIICNNFNPISNGCIHDYTQVVIVETT